MYYPSTTSKIFKNPPSDFLEIEDNSVNLLISEPLVPMAEYLDSYFFKNEEIELYFSVKEHQKAFYLMHKQIEDVFKNCFKKLKNDAIVAIITTNPLRTIDGMDRIFCNSCKISLFFLENGFIQMPSFFVYEKLGNKKIKNAFSEKKFSYNKCKEILIFKNKKERDFVTDKELYIKKSSDLFDFEKKDYFESEWDGVANIEILYRIISIFTIYEDVVLDPFDFESNTFNICNLLGRNSFIYNNNLKKIIEKNKLNKITCDKFEKEIKKLKKECKIYNVSLFNLTNFFNYNLNIPVSTESKSNISKYVIESIDEKINESSNVYDIKYKSIKYEEKENAICSQ